LLNLLIQVSDALLNGLRNVEAIYITWGEPDKNMLLSLIYLSVL
jgi:hypothetical protein